MIFAVLGVIILIVSFIVALVSLIKEQNQTSIQQQELITPKKTQVVTPSEGETSQEVGALDAGIKTNSQGPLLWDQTSEQKKIDEITKKLNEIKSESRQKLEEEPTENLVKEQKSRLSGQFSLSEIRQNHKD